ncbi:PTS sugar transporter, partial [Enterococcus faecalis]
FWLSMLISMLVIKLLMGGIFRI